MKLIQNILGSSCTEILTVLQIKFRRLKRIPHTLNVTSEGRYTCLLSHLTAQFVY